MVKQRAGRIKPLLTGILKATVGIGLVAYLVGTCWADIRARHWGQVSWPMLAAGLAVLLTATVLTFLRWFLLVRAQRLPFRIRDSLRLGFIGVFFNLLIPGAVGGDLIKAVLVARQQSRRTVAVATVVVDRIVGLIGLVVLGGLVVAICWGRLAGSAPLRQLGLWTAAVVAAVAVGSLVLFCRPVHRSRLATWAAGLPVIGGPLSEAFGAMDTYASRLGVVAAATALAVVGHVGFVMTLWCAVVALSDPPPAAHVHFMIAPLGLMVGAIPLTPGGLGLAEGAMKTLYEYAGADGTAAILMMLAYRLMQVVVALIGVAYYWASRQEALRAMAEQQTRGPGQPAAASRR